VEVLVRVALGTDPKKVLDILKRTAADHPLVLTAPEPSAWMFGFGESSLDFRLFAWTRVENFLTVSSDLHVAVNEAIRGAGIQIPVPQRDLRVRSQGKESVRVGEDGEVEVKER
jgi:small-conductance mechanosensitive channel